MSWISSGAGWRDCTPRPSGPIEPAIKTSREADSRASRAIFTPRLLRRWTSSARPWGASLKRFAPKVLVSMMCAPASMYAWCTRKTASGSVALSSSKQRCVPTASCSIEPIAPSAIRIESFSRALKSRIFTVCDSCLQKNSAREWISTLLFHEAGDGAHEVVLGEDLEARVAHFDKDRRILVAEDLRDALDGRGLRHLRERLAHHFANDELAKILALQREIQDLVFIDRADGNVFLENGNLRDVLLLHGLQGVKDGLVRTRNDQFTNFAAGVLRVNDFRRGDGGGRVHVAALAHPQIVVDFAEIARAGVRQQGDDEISEAEIPGKAECRGNATAPGAPGEKAFHFRQAARNDEAFFVVYLEDVVEDFQIHGRGEKILADAFDHVGLGFDGLAGLDEIVVQRAVGIDPDNFYAGIFFLQIFSHAADGAAGAYPANKVRDLAFAVLPNFGTGGAVVGFGIAGIVVLIRVIRIGNFAREFFGHRIIAARIFRLDGSGANDDFRAERFEEIDFFLGLFVGGGEDALVTAHRRDECQTHSGIA